MLARVFCILLRAPVFIGVALEEIRLVVPFFVIRILDLLISLWKQEGQVEHVHKNQFNLIVGGNSR